MESIGHTHLRGRLSRPPNRDGFSISVRAESFEYRSLRQAAFSVPAPTGSAVNYRVTGFGSDDIPIREVQLCPDPNQRSAGEGDSVQGEVLMRKERIASLRLIPPRHVGWFGLVSGRGSHKDPPYEERPLTGIAVTQIRTCGPLVATAAPNRSHYAGDDGDS